MACSKYQSVKETKTKVQSNKSGGSWQRPPQPPQHSRGPRLRAPGQLEIRTPTPIITQNLICYTKSCLKNWTPWQAYSSSDGAHPPAVAIVCTTWRNTPSNPFCAPNLLDQLSCGSWRSIYQKVDFNWSWRQEKSSTYLDDKLFPPQMVHLHQRCISVCNTWRDS